MLYNAEAVSAILCILYQVNLTVIIRVLCNVSREIEIVAWKPMSLLSLLIDFRYDMTSLIKTIHIYGPSFSHEYLYGYVRSYLDILILSPLHIKDIGIHWWFNQEMVLHNLTNKQNICFVAYSLLLCITFFFRVYTLLSFKNAIVTNVKKIMDSV